jgi:AcrR family transcriptional regulator
MSYDAEATRRRLLDAAIYEFSEFGIMGARIERIAARAVANRQAIYLYFQNKEGLFAAAFEDRIRDFHKSVHFDELDLPEFAGRMFDKFEDSPDTRRLTLWYHLERSVTTVPVPLIVESTQREVLVIRDAQARGVLPGKYDAAALLGLVRSIALTWHTQVPQLHLASPAPRAVKRALVVNAVRSLLAE